MFTRADYGVVRIVCNEAQSECVCVCLINVLMCKGRMRDTVLFIIFSGVNL